MKIWAISDVHGHQSLLIPPKVDAVFFGGDCSNSSQLINNHQMVSDFIIWMSTLDIKHKVFVAGNHDVCIERNTLNIKQLMKEHNIHYLENESITIENVSIWGSPITPTFGQGWAFNRDRGKIYKYWDEIPEGTDVVITHGPPKGILDSSYDRDGNLEHCGCANLRKRIEQIKPKYHIFGHIHNMKGVTNQGVFHDSSTDIKYINASIVEDGKFGKITNNGVVFDINV